MNRKKLHFFDKNGYNLNFDWNNRSNCWEGNIYLPKVSVGLYANTTIYVLEEVDGEFTFPLKDNDNKLTFSWDSFNKFVDEFFMFNFDDTYIIKDTSALHYEPNDGPECNTLIINRFDTYEIELKDEQEPIPLPLHIAFSAKEKYDATTYKRTLIMKCGKDIVARITFFAETVEEDERLKIWNDNLGYNIKPEDTIIFKTSDIKEYKPNYTLLNEKRKELMLEGHEIYPYIGSYKAIINAIKFFGYDNLSIIEYWKNVNPNDENFGKIYHSSKYSLTKKETLRVGSRNISLPNKDYKKNNQIALVYSINKPIDDFDEWELPKVKELFAYTIEEALIKLFALRKKLDKEFMPGSSRIIDIIGEANYFGIQCLRKTNMECALIPSKKEDRIRPMFDAYPGKNIHLTDNRYFNKYIIEECNKNEEIINHQNLICDISDMKIEELDKPIDEFDIPTIDSDIYGNFIEKKKADLYKDFYNKVYVDYERYIDDVDTDDEFAKSTAKVVLINTTFDAKTFDNDICFGFKLEDEEDIAFDNVNVYGHHNIKWEVKMTNRIQNMNNLPKEYDDEVISMFGQEDEELKKIGIRKSYFEGLSKDEIDERLNWYKEKEGTLEELNEVLFELPYVGYYDVTLTIDGASSTISKYIKVEPYNLEIKGFYYDARDLPKELKYGIAQDDDIYKFILDRVREMTAWAIPEHTVVDNQDMSMAVYGTNVDENGELESYKINKGPYIFDKMKEDWCLMDNLDWDMSILLPRVMSGDNMIVKYIRHGVDVKPYTWFLLGYEYSKAIGKVKPKWTLINNTTGKSVEFEGMYLTCLLKDEGNYTVKLNLEDSRGNKYNISRNIFVVDKIANHKIYQTFKKEYDEYMEEDEFRRLKSLETF